MRILVGDCPWCETSLMEQVKAKERSFDNAETTCDNCGNPVILAGDTVVTVKVLKPPPTEEEPPAKGLQLLQGGKKDSPGE